MKLFNFKIRNGILKKYRGAGGDVTIPNRVRSIGEEAFRGCEGLTSVVIPDSVTSIGTHAFWGCKNLTDIQFTGTIAQWKAISKGAYWNYNTGNYTVTCTDGTVPKDGAVTPK